MIKTALENDLVKSIVLHVSIVLVLVIYGTDFNFFHNNEDLMIVKSAVRVDLVGMPKHTLKELQALNQPESKIEKSEATAPSPQPKEIEEVDANEGDFLKRVQSLAKKKQPVKVKKKAEGSGKTQRDFSKLILEGNKISKGSALTGDTLAEDLDVFSKYVTQLPDIVRSNWTIPAYLKGEGLSCKIRIYVNKSGVVIKKEVIESSGDVDFDNTALRAIELSTPFPAPAQEIAKYLIDGKVVLAFPL